MDPLGASKPQVLSQEALSTLAEGISLVLSQWTALQIAVENEWGGRGSRQKSDQLALDILNWFTKSKDPHYIDDLENILDEGMVLSFNTEIEDGSVEEVAERLMILHEECLQGNYESIEKMRKTRIAVNAVSQSRQVMDENGGESSDEDDSSMVVDELKPRPPVSQPSFKPRDTIEDEPKMKGPMDVDEDGWSVVPPRRTRGKKSG